MKMIMKNLVLSLFILLSSYALRAQHIGIDFTKAAEHTVNAVVHIQCEYEQETTFYSDFFYF